MLKNRSLSKPDKEELFNSKNFGDLSLFLSHLADPIHLKVLTNSDTVDKIKYPVYKRKRLSKKEQKLKKQSFVKSDELT